MPAREDEILIYAAGAGWGHLNRALSLAFKISRKYKTKIISNSAYAKQIKSSLAFAKHASNQKIEIVDLFGIDADSFSKQVKELFSSQDFRCVVVDTFPRGLVGELAELLCVEIKSPKVLIHRDINPEYVAKFEIETFVGKNFDLILNPGERTSLPLAHLCENTAPWLLKDASEVANKKEARKLIGLENDKTPLILICASGKETEQDFYIELAKQIRSKFHQAAVRCLVSHKSANEESLFIRYWPGIDLINAASIVIGAGGYNTINECEALQITLLALPQNRLYDRQLQRINASCAIHVDSTEKIFEKLSTFIQLEANEVMDRQCHNYVNGTEQAFELIDKLISKTA